MADALRKNGRDPCSEFKIGDFVSGFPFGVSLEGTANFLIDRVVEGKIELRPSRRRANIAKHEILSSAEVPASQTADVDHILIGFRSFLAHRESLRTAWDRPFFGLATEYIYLLLSGGSRRRARIAIGRNVAHG
jgi:hypothetical protein